MNCTVPVLQRVEGTTVDTDVLRAYLVGMPKYLHFAYDVGASKHACDLLNYTDFFEFRLKRYLCGRQKTLHGIFHEVRQFMAFDATSAPRMIGFSLDAVERELKKNEWYELLPDLLWVRRRIEGRFGITSTGDLERILSDQHTSLPHLL